MKAILFGCLVAVFASCTKPTIEFKIPPIDLASNYTWDNITITPADSSNTVTAEITADGIISKFSTAGPGNTFTRSIVALSSGDSSTISIFAFDNRLSTVIRFDMVNILSEGTYTIDNTAGLHKTVMASCTIGNDIYPSEHKTLSGSLTIDTLTAHHIHGLFSITCSKGTQTVDIRNGSFAGNF